MKYPFIALGVLGLVASSTQAAYADNSNVNRALAGHSDVSTFYQTLLNTGVMHELNEKTEYTIFAPTNAAFAEFQPTAYPCFYSVQCRTEVAAVIRNHIVPYNESIASFSKWGGGIPTIGVYSLNVDEPFAGQYEVENNQVLDHSDESGSNHFAGEGVSLYRIDGVIASNEQMATLRSQPVADAPNVVSQKTVTTYRTTAPVPSAGYVAPGGYTTDNSTVLTPAEMSDGDHETTTTTTQTTITQ